MFDKPTLDVLAQNLAGDGIRKELFLLHLKTSSKEAKDRIIGLRSYLAAVATESSKKTVSARSVVACSDKILSHCKEFFATEIAVMSK